MADQQLIDLAALETNVHFNNLEAVQPAFQALPDTNWTEAAFSTIQIWHGVQLEDPQRLLMGEEWLTALGNGNISVSTAIKGFKLAMSLKSVSAGDNTCLLRQQERPEQAANGVLARANIPAIDNFSAVNYSLRPVQVQPGPEQALPAVPAQAVQVQAQVNVGRQREIPADTDRQKTQAYCYIAAFLMKLLVKPPENITGGIKNMKTRYEAFYGPCRIIRGFTLGAMHAQAYKEALLNQPHVGLTYTHAIAYTHQERYDHLTTQDARLLSYLCFLPFAYRGMHAYTLMLDLKKDTKVSLGKLLTLFYANITAPALNRIAHIVRTYERTEEAPNRDVKFRYCGLWGHQYFSTLKSKNCVHLLYTISCAWKCISSTGQNSDPEKIAALSSLSIPMKRTLKAAGEIIGTSLKSTMLGGVNAPAAQVEQEGAQNWDDDY